MHRSFSARTHEAAELTEWPYPRSRLPDDNCAAGRTSNFSSSTGTAAPKDLNACCSAVSCLTAALCDVAVCVLLFRLLCWMIITTHSIETSFLCLNGASLTRKKKKKASLDCGALLCRSYFTAQDSAYACVREKKRGLWGWKKFMPAML